MLAASLATTPGLATSSTTPIQHVIIIMQENRSFDNYFGTFPGADGIPPGVCVPVTVASPQQGCVVPFHDPHDVNAAANHAAIDAQFDLDDGITTDKLDGFVQRQTQSYALGCRYVIPCIVNADGNARHDVMGYHTADEIPNYWSYAQNFVLQDHLFESVRSWSLPSHIYLTSEWVAVCTDPTAAATCVTDPTGVRPGKGVEYPWVNLFQLLDVHGVSWKYYLDNGPEPDCEDDQMSCEPQLQNSMVNSIWNPGPDYGSVIAQGTAYLREHNPPIDQFLVDVQNGNLPQVSWVVPNGLLSEHPPSGVTAGMEYVTSLVNAVMQSPYWNSTAIFIAWDDWGGFYDNIAPPNVDYNSTTTPVQGYGLRVPGLMISAYAKAGYIDHSVLSVDSYATLFEDLFAGGARLDPTALGNPDSRPTIRDALTSVTLPGGGTAPIGKLIDEFDFSQTPRPPLVLSTHIPSGISIQCRLLPYDTRESCTFNKVKISWTSLTGPGIPGPFTYHITRDGVDLPQCTGTSVGCSDKPPPGAHLYRAYSVDANGVTSPPSAAAEADTR